MTDADVDSPVADQLVSLYYVKSELTRRRWVWLTTALIGLLIGGGFHVIVPRTYEASTLLVLAHNPADDPDRDMATDVVLATTSPVADAVIRQLHLPTTSQAFLKEYSATSLTSSLINITLKAPSYALAVKRVNAVSAAFLSFRSAQLQAQNQLVVTALETQSRSVQAQIDALTATIDGTPSGNSTHGAGSGQSKDLADAVAERTQAAAQLNQLQSTIQADRLSTTSEIEGSHLINSGIPLRHSPLKLEVLNLMTGLIGGLGLGVFAVIIAALMSDRLRRRDDVGAALEAPIAISIRRLHGPRRTSTRRRSLEPAVGYLHRALSGQPTGRPRTFVAVSVESDRSATVILTAIADRLVAQGRSVVLVDLTSGGQLSRAYGLSGSGRRSRHKPTQASSAAQLPSSHEAPATVERDGLTVVRPANTPVTVGPWAAPEQELLGDLTLLRICQSADVVITLAEVDPGAGAGALATWARDAVPIVTAGQASGTKLHSIGRLIRAAGLSIPAVILLGADSQDESVGLPTRPPQQPSVDRPVGMAKS